MKLGRFHHRRRRQSGYILMVLIFFLTVMILLMAATAPRIAQQVQRDREEEMIHRGAQYSRAIKRYFKKFGRYPGSLEQLENTNNLRFIRKLYKDPLSKDGKWRELHPGDVKLGGQSNVGTPVSAMAAKPFGSQQPGQGFSLGQPASAGASPQQRPTGTTTGGGFGSGGSAFGAPGAVLGSAIIGVASTSEKEGIHEFNEKKNYNEWYFVYDPTIDRGGLISGPYTGKTFMATGGSVVGTPGATGLGTPIGQQPGGMMGQPGGMMGQPGGMGQQPSPPMSQRPPQ